MALNFHLTMLHLIVVFTVGCSPPASQFVSVAKPKPGSEPQMHEIVGKEATVQVLKNVDRPFEATLEPSAIWIDPTDPVIAHCVMFCTHSIDGRQTRSLFLVTFDNNAYPNFATDAAELTCVLINRDGTVLSRDMEFWDGYSPDELAQSGATNTDGPPFVATGMVEMAELRRETH